MADQYARRIVNINVNITVASVVAALLASGVLHLTRYMGIPDGSPLIPVIGPVVDWAVDLIVAVGLHWLANHWPKRWKRSRQLIDRADSVIDAAPPPGLSLMKDASQGTHLPHLPHIPLLDRPEEAKPKAEIMPVKQESFVRDATAIQLQRLCLSPLFYLIGVGGLWLAENRWHWPREVAFFTWFCAAIVVTRVLHTIWLYKVDAQVLEEYEQARKRRQENNVYKDKPTGV